MQFIEQEKMTIKKNCNGLMYAFAVSNMANVIYCYMVDHQILNVYIHKYLRVRNC